MTEKSDISFKTGFSEEGHFDASQEEAESFAHSYRAVCKTAVVSFVISIPSVLAVLLAVDFDILTIIPLLGFVLGLTAVLKIRKMPHELTGRSLAMVGMIVCGLEFAGGQAYHWIYYLNEVPEDSIRVTFDELQPKGNKQQRKRQRISQKAWELNGKKVFIKGYVGPNAKKNNLKKFTLVWTLEQCCFGTTPEATHQIAIVLADGLSVDYGVRPKRLTGTLKVNPNVPEGAPGFTGYYRLEADRIW